MERRQIIPLAPADRGKPGVAVEVKQTGSHPLDVRLLGSEGEFPYVATIKQRNISSFKSKASNEEWEAILSYFLLRKQPEGDRASFLDGVRMEYTLGGEVLRITIRRDVQGIKMTLGQIELHREPDEELDPIDWAYASAQAHNLTLRELADLKAKLDGEQGTLDKLNAQLDDFIKAKNETETAMLQQFMTLLNEKKRKIRDQSRLLAGAKADSATVSAVQSAREETKTRRAGPSRPSKRKAPAKTPAAKEDDYSDEAQMEIDQSKAEEQDDESGPEAATPDRSADEETEDEGNSPLLASQPTEKVVATEREASTTRATRSATREPPPRRELPFGRHKATRKQPSRPSIADDDDDTEDEEL